jgi:putative endonuclease
MNHKIAVGKFGEKLAKDFLIRHGYEIIDTNVKVGYKEIDIIAKIGQNYHFIEVKTRIVHCLPSESSEAFDEKKMENLRQAIFRYITENNIDDLYVNLDLITVDYLCAGRTAKIRLFPNMF